MIFGSLFSGIGGFDLGLERAGLVCSWQVEIDRHCRKLLNARWPDVERHEDVRTVGTNLAPVDLICGGFPCQDLSVAGDRAGLGGERSGLWFEFHRILALARPSVCLIENVPGLLSSDEGRDLAIILRGLVDCGYGVAWRVLDAQFAGLAQRRQRVFIVGSLGTGRCAEILFEPASVRWDPAPHRPAGQGVGPTLESRAGSGSPGTDAILNGGSVLAPTLRVGGREQGAGSSADNTPLVMSQRDAGTFIPTVADPISGSEARTYTHEGNTFRLHNTVPDVAWALQERDSKGADSDTKEGHLIPAPMSVGENGRGETRLGDVSRAMSGGGGKPGQGFPAALTSMGVRRLTPRECERLQGFPDDWTAGFKDSTRYRMLGNAVAVPVAAWLGRRIVESA